MRDDLKVIGDLCDALGGLSATARELSTDEQQLTPQHIYNWRTRGRVHRAYWIAGAAVLAVQVLRVPVSTTHAWDQVVSALLAFFP